MHRQTFIRIARQAPFHDAGHGYDVFGMHPPALATAVDMAAPLYERYFRVTSHDAERIPRSGPAILVANHAGVLPIDAAMLCMDVLRRTDPPRIPRPIVEHFVPSLPIFSTWFARLGAVAGTRANVRHLLEHDELVAIWPEGITGPGKPFRDRYHLQAWSVGFAELAIRHHALVVPVAILGAEESWPLIARIGRVRAGTPYVPIPLVPLPLPAHFHIYYGEPIALAHVASDADDPEVVTAAAQRVRCALQRQIDNARIVRRGVFR